MEPLKWNVAFQQPGYNDMIALRHPVLVLAYQQDVGACFKGGRSHFNNAPFFGKGPHLQVVRDDQPLVPHLFPQQMVQDARQD